MVFYFIILCDCFTLSMLIFFIIYLTILIILFISYQINYFIKLQINLTKNIPKSPSYLKPMPIKPITCHETPNNELFIWHLINVFWSKFFWILSQLLLPKLSRNLLMLAWLLLLGNTLLKKSKIWKLDFHDLEQRRNNKRQKEDPIFLTLISLNSTFFIV